MKSNILKILVNGDHRFEYQKSRGIPGQVRSMLSSMDEAMDKSGVYLGGSLVPSPSQSEKNQYVIGELIDALHKNNDPVALAMCQYLSIHYSSLSGIDVVISGNSFDVRLETAD